MSSISNGSMQRGHCSTKERRVRQASLGVRERLLRVLRHRRSSSPRFSNVFRQLEGLRDVYRQFESDLGLRERSRRLRDDF